MDPIDELERMAMNVAQEAELDNEASPEEITRWQKLFSYTYEQAAKMIQQHNHDYTRTRLTTEQWDMIRTELEAQGYDRSAYEHQLAISGKRANQTQPSNGTFTEDTRGIYVLKLEGPLGNPELVKVAAGLLKEPECVQGRGDDGDASFCYIDGLSKQAILNWLSVNATTFLPTIARITQKAPKDLSAFSIYPTLGIDSILPQYRAATDSAIPFEPEQDQYPVWYFFYGTLADAAILSRQLGISDQDSPPILHPATISRGVIKMWAGKYKALVDASEGTIVHGSAYQVVCKKHEDSLRAYETDNYEVVRCTIYFASRTIGVCEEVNGCTFRFVGTIDGL